MSPRVRKVVLTAHISTSVGWLGAVMGYVVLDITAATSQDVQTLRAVYLAMELTVRYVIVPLAVATVFIGIINALGTPWGLLRHYWVLIKLLLTLAATTVLMIEAQTVSALAEQATSRADPSDLPGTLPHSVSGSLVLLTATVLSVFKPRGLTRFGWRKQRELNARGTAHRQ